ncbi:GntR family transcriptional regulator [Oceaniglobus trochenteri]|uniref:GntR family transcriptional regulator n=1 Tax=Oceaniglobus trochenteri TaxID=2763260 RepID=UPI001D00052E|nr:GntR family transcriptional regulator [Oceaniglobus trochenteri]
MPSSKLENSSGAQALPLHLRLRQAILDEIAAGTWKPDQQIASERELCERYGISRITARRAIADLVNDGVLVTASGKGTFVAGKPLKQELQPLVGFVDDMREQGFEVHSRLLDLRRIEASPDLAEALEIGEYSPVVHLKRLRMSGAHPLVIQSSYLPEHLCPGLLRLEFDNRSLYQTLRDDYGLHLVSGSTTIEAAIATDDEAGLLGLKPGGAVLRTAQTTRLEGDEVIELCRASFHGGRFQLTVGGKMRTGLHHVE